MVHNAFQEENSRRAGDVETSIFALARTMVWSVKVSTEASLYINSPMEKQHRDIRVSSEPVGSPLLGTSIYAETFDIIHAQSVLNDCNTY